MRSCFAGICRQTDTAVKNACKRSFPALWPQRRMGMRYTPGPSTQNTSSHASVRKPPLCKHRSGLSGTAASAHLAHLVHVCGVGVSREDLRPFNAAWLDVHVDEVKWHRNATRACHACRHLVTQAHLSTASTPQTLRTPSTTPLNASPVLAPTPFTPSPLTPTLSAHTPPLVTEPSNVEPSPETDIKPQRYVERESGTCDGGGGARGVCVLVQVGPIECDYRPTRQGVARSVAADVCA